MAIVSRINGFLTGQTEASKQDTNGLPYKSYAAFLNQENEADPAVTVLRNELGDITWSRYGTGILQASCPLPVFPIDRRAVIFGAPSGLQSPVRFAEYADEGVNPSYIRIECIDNLDRDSDNLVNQFIEIRVYY